MGVELMMMMMMMNDFFSSRVMISLNIEQGYLLLQHIIVLATGSSASDCLTIRHVVPDRQSLGVQHDVVGIRRKKRGR